jgi:antitoxin MazE
MTTQVAKWGNSLGVRLPKSIAQDARLGAGDKVDVSIEGDAVVIRRARRRYTIEELVAGITKKNRHRHVDWGPPVGGEVW